MSVSIVLRVKNEARMLHDVLQGVERQNYRGDMDVVVVDSGSTDGTLEIARAHNCRIFCIKPEDFSWGYALNLGAEKSTGDFIAYLSGHCVPVDEFWLENLLAPFEDASVGGVYSRHVPIVEIDPFEAIELEYFWFPAGSGEPTESDAFSNASSALRRSTWESVKFDEKLLMVEDGDWANRARAAGWKIIYQPRSKVYHSHPPRVENIYRRWFSRCYAAKKILPRTREGSLLYLMYKTLLCGWLDLKYLARHGLLSRFWQIPLYEAARQLGAYNGARAAIAGKPFDRWHDVPVPRILEKLCKPIER
ncbi:MAG TPA: glycosyltransferase [Candidatus Sumerlaeia bacterium]|nr:glycosyltransferase [Candidatus Sumerlaeia bacterium]